MKKKTFRPTINIYRDWSQILWTLKAKMSFRSCTYSWAPKTMNSSNSERNFLFSKRRNFPFGWGIIHPLLHILGYAYTFCVFFFLFSFFATQLILTWSPWVGWKKRGNSKQSGDCDWCRDATDPYQKPSQCYANAAETCGDGRYSAMC